MPTSTPPAQSNLESSQAYEDAPHDPLMVSDPAGHEHISPSQVAKFPFLALPSEVRNMIYSLVLTNQQNITWIQNDQYLCHPLSLSEITTSRNCSFCHQQPKRPGRDILDLSTLLVCSQIYNETYLLPYTLNTFVMDTSEFLGFLHARSPAQLHTLCSVYVRLFIRNRHSFRDLRIIMVSAAAEELTGLKDLKLRITAFNRTLVPDAGAEIVRGAMAWMGRGLEVRLRVVKCGLREVVREVTILPDDLVGYMSERMKQLVMEEPYRGDGSGS